MRVQQELDETKIVLVRIFSFVDFLSCAYVWWQHKTIESVLQRGEKLDNLVERSTALSAQSKMFYKTAKKVRQSLITIFVDRPLGITAKLLLHRHVRRATADVRSILRLIAMYMYTYPADKFGPVD